MFFLLSASAIVDFGGNPSKWEDTWRTDSAVEKNVDKTERYAQSVCFQARQLCGAPGVDPVGNDSPHPGLLCVQSPQSGSGDQTHT